MQTRKALAAELLGASSPAALIVDSAGLVVASNRAAEALFDCDPRDFVGRRVANFIRLRREVVQGEAPASCSDSSGNNFEAAVSKIAIALDREPHSIYSIRIESDPGSREIDSRFQEAILELARVLESENGDFRSVSGSIARHVSRVMRVERVSIWLLVDEGATLECAALYQLSGDSITSGSRLNAEQYPRYFAALERGRAIAANDATRDSRTSEFATGYLDVLGISSMLDSVLRASGKVIGVVCFEHVGSDRIWSEDEIIFASEVADRATNTYLVSQNRQADAARIKLEGKLREAQKLEAIGRLAGGVAHDFNNLLSIILGNAEFAESTNLPPQVQTWMAEIRAAGAQASDLTSQLLSIGRRQVLELRPIDLNQLIDDKLKLLRRTIPSSIQINFEPSSEPAVVSADPGHLDQVIYNLCLNARDAILESGVIDLSVRTEPGSEGQPDWVVLRVADNGVGMPAEVREKLFEPFFTTKIDSGGTGLGLSMVYGIAKQHSGHIEVESRPNEGTTIDVFIPATNSVPDDLDMTLQPASPAPMDPNHKDALVLVVEDSKPIRKLLGRLLERAGYRVILASDGAEAIELHGENADAISLVLLDIVLPKRTGEEVFEAIHERSPDLAVLFTSGYGEQSLSESFRRNHSIPIIQKPWKSDELLQAVHAAIAN